MKYTHIPKHSQTYMRLYWCISEFLYVFTCLSEHTPITSNDFDIIISCGRKSVIPSIYLKKNSKRKVQNIHIQDPKVSLNNFDFIIAPEHDGLTGDNVILSKGSIHYLTKEEITNNHEYLSEKLNKEKEYLSLILGGPNKYYDYNEKNLIKIFDLFLPDTQ